jgi:hypothetical protein
VIADGNDVAFRLDQIEIADDAGSGDTRKSAPAAACLKALLDKSTLGTTRYLVGGTAMRS